MSPFEYDEVKSVLYTGLKELNTYLLYLIKIKFYVGEVLIEETAAANLFLDMHSYTAISMQYLVEATFKTCADIKKVRDGI